MSNDEAMIATKDQWSSLLHYSFCPHHHVEGDRVLCRDPGRPWRIGTCRHPGECCWDCEALADCEHACPDAAASAAREMMRSCQRRIDHD